MEAKTIQDISLYKSRFRIGNDPVITKQLKEWTVFLDYQKKNPRKRKSLKKYIEEYNLS